MENSEAYRQFEKWMGQGRIHTTTETRLSLWLTFKEGYKHGLAKSPEPNVHDVLRELRAERDRLIEKTTPEAERSTFFPR